MFKVFVLVPGPPPWNWQVKETEVVASKADAKTSVRKLSRKYRGQTSMVQSYPANQVPVYIPH